MPASHAHDNDDDAYNDNNDDLTKCMKHNLRLKYYDS